MVTNVIAIPLDEQGFAPPMDHDSAGGPIVLRDFWAGPENALVRSVVDSIKPDRPPWNPLVLYGAAGTGKSHLARGLARRRHQRSPSDRVVILTGADFARRYAKAIRDERPASLRQSILQQADFFILEDLEEIARKRSAQEELARLLDELIERGIRVVITCNRSPLENESFDRRLVGRLIGGLVIPLVPPGSAARQAIIIQLARLRGITPAGSAAKALADAVPGTVPQIHRMLIELETSGLLENGRLDLSSAKRFIAQKIQSRRPSLQTIATTVAKYYGVRVADMKGPTRKQSVVQARSMAMFLARNLTTKSLQEIGLHFGRRDHTTAMHACRKIEKQVCTHPEIRTVVETLCQTLLSR